MSSAYYSFNFGSASIVFAISTKEAEGNVCRCRTSGSASGAAGRVGMLLKACAKFMIIYSIRSFWSWKPRIETRVLKTKGANVFFAVPK